MAIKNRPDLITFIRSLIVEGQVDEEITPENDNLTRVEMVDSLLSIISDLAGDDDFTNPLVGSPKKYISPYQGNRIYLRRNAQATEAEIDAGAAQLKFVSPKRLAYAFATYISKFDSTDVTMATEEEQLACPILVDTVVVRLTIGVPLFIKGFDNPSKGIWRVLTNVSELDIPIYNQSGDADAEKRIITGTGGTYLWKADTTIAIYYDFISLRWRLWGVGGGSGGGNQITDEDTIALLEDPANWLDSYNNPAAIGGRYNGTAIDAAEHDYYVSPPTLSGEPETKFEYEILKIGEDLTPIRRLYYS